MENKLTLEHLAPYLPYGLNMTFNLPNNSNQTGKLLSLGITLDCYLTAYVQLSDTEARQIRFSKSYKDSLCKPILRPMSDINKPINHADYKGINVAKQYELTLFEGNWCDCVYAEYGETPKAYIPVTEINTFMFKFHFDVFGLIEKGLAIDINTLQK